MDSVGRNDSPGHIFGLCGILGDDKKGRVGGIGFFGESLLVVGVSLVNLNGENS